MIRMDTEQYRLPIYIPCHAPLLEFIRFWEKRYFEDSDKPYTSEKLYTTNINRPHHSVETLSELFHWKMGVHFYSPKSRVKQHFLSRIEEATELRQRNVSAEEFLQRFSDGGPIYRIFWLHCWYPDRCPIYDQHVHRAMSFIREGQLDELDNYSEREKIDKYLQCYVPFFEQFHVGIPFDQELDGVWLSYWTSTSSRADSLTQRAKC
jgi:hypothetical protein